MYWWWLRAVARSVAFVYHGNDGITGGEPGQVGGAASAFGIIYSIIGGRE